MGYRTSTVSNGDGTETWATRWVGWSWWDVMGVLFWGSWVAIMVTLGLVCQ